MMAGLRAPRALPCDFQGIFLGIFRE